MYLTWYRSGDRATRKLAHCNPHGRWLEWKDFELVNRAASARRHYLLREGLDQLRPPVLHQDGRLPPLSALSIMRKRPSGCTL